MSPSERSVSVEIYDFGEEEGEQYIAMELVEGRTLSQFIEPGAATVEQKIGWLGDLAQALGVVHEAGLVHRDVKPDNVLIRVDGVLKLLDFGVAKRSTVKSADVTATSSRGPASFRTAAGIIVGTPLYMSPEQLLDDPLDGRSDQYCWGLLAYELLTGGSARDPTVHPLRYHTEDPAPLADVAPELPRHVCDAVMRALSRSKSERFDSMADVALALGVDPSRTARTVPPAPKSSDPTAPYTPSAAFDLVPAPRPEPPPAHSPTHSRSVARARSKALPSVPLFVAAGAGMLVLLTIGVVIGVHGCPSSTTSEPAVSPTVPPTPVLASTPPPATSSSAPAPSASTSASSSTASATSASGSTSSSPPAARVHLVRSDVILPRAAAELLAAHEAPLGACLGEGVTSARCTLAHTPEGAVKSCECHVGAKLDRTLSSCVSTVLPDTLGKSPKKKGLIVFDLQARR